MKINEIKVTFVGMEPTDSIKAYAITKLTKHENNLEKATSMEIVAKDNIKNKGVKSDFELNLKIVLPKGFIGVDETGSDLYALIDRTSDVLAKRFKRYFDKFNQWEGEQPWKVLEANEYIDSNLIEDDIENFVTYTPRISVRETMQDMRPMEEAEAVELMELSGKDQFLFRNKKTDKISMVYRRKEGSFGLVEPQNDL